MKKKINRIPRQYTLVRYMPYPQERGSPFPEKALLFLGEIPNMPGHCVVVSSDKICIGYHTDRFEEISEDQI